MPAASETAAEADTLRGAGIQNDAPRGLREVHLPKLDDESDWLTRRRRALMALCRAERRVVSVDEALDWLKANHLYSEPWENPGRRAKVKSILRYIARTFDSAKSKQGGKVRLGEYSALAAKMAQYTPTVSSKWWEIALAVAVHCVRHRNSNETVPQERAKQLEIVAG